MDELLKTPTRRAGFHHSVYLLKLLCLKQATNPKNVHGNGEIQLIFSTYAAGLARYISSKSVDCSNWCHPLEPEPIVYADIARILVKYGITSI